MRFAFDVTTCVKARRGGVPTYGWNLVRACARVAPEHDYVLAVRSHRWMRRSLIADLLPGVKPRLLVDGLQDLTMGGKVDTLHGIGIRLPAGGRFAKTVMVHDLNVFEHPELSEPSWRDTRQARIRETVARADLVLSYSEQGAAALGEYVDVPREKVRVVPPGVDTELFHRPADEVLLRVCERHGLLGRPYMLMVGGYSDRKNPHGLLDAFADATQHGSLDDSWVLVLAGPRHAGQEALRVHAEQRGLGEDRLRLPGWINDDELPALLAGAGLYVCSSLHEGFGLPVLEAQACGAPVACSDRGALVETLGGCGVLFDPGDRDGFAEALCRLAADGELRADLARRGVERVRAGFGWELVARRTLEVMSEAAGRP